MKHSAYISLAIILFLSTAWCHLGAQEIQIPTTSKSRGVPAYPFPVTVEQPDGTSIRIRAMGDRMLRLYETEDGYTVLQDKKGTYVYATLDDAQQLVPSGVAVAPAKGTPDGIEKHLRYSKEQVDAAKKAYFADTQSKANPTPFPSSGTNNVLVILAEFNDRAASLPPANIESMMSAPNHNGTGSFRDYYLEVSYNTLSLEPVVTPWVQVSRNMTWYGGNDAFGYDIRPQELVREAVELVEASGFDFSQFDNDNDGYVDEIILIHAGYGEQYIGSGDTAIWSHAFHLGDLAVEYDGVILDNYIISPELYGSSGTQLTSIGTVVHEFAHSLAIPDIYDIDLEGSGGYAFDPNFWDLMAVGSWNNNGITPAGINVWLKQYMGWLTIPIIDTTGTFTLNPAIHYQEAYQLNTPVYNEYFIVENRQRTGFDSYIPGEGMLIYHVDLNYPGWLTGEMNVDPTHQGFDIEEADNIRDTVSLPGDPFPGTANVTSFDSLSVPGSNTWDGNSSGVTLHNITQTGDVISFEITNTIFSELPAGWNVDELSYTQMGTVTGVPVVGGEPAVSGYVAAFVGAECRGVGSVTYHTGSGRYISELLVFSNSTGGEILEFRYYDPAQDSVYALYETLPFAVGIIAGNTDDPFLFHTPVHYTRNFTAGWNWFSLNVDMRDMRPGAIFTTCATQDDYVKSQTKSTTYYSGYGWFGPLDTLNTRDLYIANLETSCGIDVWGAPSPTATVTRNLVAGWNWVGYTPQAAMTPADALASMTPTHLDYIKSQTQSATYYSSYGWFGPLEVMYPGQGYMMRLAAADELVYPTVAPSGKKALQLSSEDIESAAGSQRPVVSGGPNEAGTGSGVDPYRFEFNGTLTATVTLEGASAASEKDLLTAWSGNEMRGQVQGRWFEPAGKVVFPLMVFSNQTENEPLTFSYFHAVSQTTYAVEGTIMFSKDMVLGDAMEAVEMNVAGALGTEALVRQGDHLSVYPNPASDQVNIRFSLSSQDQVNISLYNIYGSLVWQLADQEYPAGAHTIRRDNRQLPAGNYVVKFRTGKTTAYTQIVFQ